MPVANGLTTETKSKNNSRGDRIHCGAMIDKELFRQFNELADRKCLQKAAVLRRLIKDFVETERFTTEESNG